MLQSAFSASLNEARLCVLIHFYLSNCFPILFTLESLGTTHSKAVMFIFKMDCWNYLLEQLVSQTPLLSYVSSCTVLASQILNPKQWLHLLFGLLGWMFQPVSKYLYLTLDSNYLLCCTSKQNWSLFHLYLDYAQSSSTILPALWDVISEYLCFQTVIQSLNIWPFLCF